jgi:hypothetical protein
VDLTGSGLGVILRVWLHTVGFHNNEMDGYELLKEARRPVVRRMLQPRETKQESVMFLPPTARYFPRSCHCRGIQGGTSATPVRDLARSNSTGGVFERLFPTRRSWNVLRHDYLPIVALPEVALSHYRETSRTILMSASPACRGYRYCVLGTCSSCHCGHC